LLKIIKVCLEGEKGAWSEELPNVLWAYRITARTPTRETPFRLIYGTEAVIPIEIGITSMRREFFQGSSNDDQLKVNLDCLDETREEASKMTEYYNKRVKLRRLNIRDLVLCRITPATKDSAQGKLRPTWEGPYKIIHYSKQGSYHLESMDGKRLPRPWDIEHLKRYHH